MLVSHRETLMSSSAHDLWMGLEDLQGCRFREAHWQRIRCDRTVFMACEWTECRLEDVVFEGIDFSRACFRKTTLIRCYFVDCQCIDMQWNQVRFEDCCFEGGEIARVSGSKVAFERGSWRSVPVSDSVWHACQWKDYQMSHLTLARGYWIQCCWLKFHWSHVKLDRVTIQGGRLQSGRIFNGQLKDSLWTEHLRVYDVNIHESEVSGGGFQNVRFFNTHLLKLRCRQSHFLENRWVKSRWTQFDFESVYLTGSLLLGMALVSGLWIGGDASDVMCRDLMRENVDVRQVHVLGGHGVEIYRGALYAQKSTG